MDDMDDTDEPKKNKLPKVAKVRFIQYTVLVLHFVVMWAIIGDFTFICRGQLGLSVDSLICKSVVRVRVSDSVQLVVSLGRTLSLAHIARQCSKLLYQRHGQA